MDLGNQCIYKRRKASENPAMDALSLIKDCLHEDFENAHRAWEGPAPVMEVRIPGQELMDLVAQYALNAAILFFPGNMPPAQDVGDRVQMGR
ncbi:hypothetical protein GOP47_0031155 [Adiantum capillus-veneris]|nr:hypothetical protein GOP47_0031155 [Adiantum capillus-veneris]